MPDSDRQTVGDLKPRRDLSNEEFRQVIAGAEVSAGHENDGYAQRNTGPLNALGRYQLTTGALLEAKWKVGSTWTDKARAFGIASDDDFLNNPEAQEAALADVMKDYERQTRAMKLFQHTGQTYIGVSNGPVAITDAGIVAAAHREGATATANYLQRRVNGRESDDPKARKTDELVEKRLRDFADILYRRGGW